MTKKVEVWDDEDGIDKKGMKWGIICVIFLVIVFAIYNYYELKPMTEFEYEDVDYFPCVEKWCIDNGYDSLFDIEERVDFFRVHCKGIINLEMRIDPYDFYKEEFPKLC